MARTPFQPEEDEERNNTREEAEAAEAYGIKRKQRRVREVGL